MSDFAFDMHVHTTASDGAFTPAEIVREAARLGLAGLAITDHDTLDGLSEAAAAARLLPVSLIFGVELNCVQAAAKDKPEREVHMLGYFLDIRERALNARLKALQAERRRRGAQMVENLAGLGMPLDSGFLRAYERTGAVSRGLLARKLVEAGYAADKDEVFARWLGVGRPAYVPRQRLAAEEAVIMIHGAGGVAVMAHPVQAGDDRLVGILAAAGLDGLECRHPDQQGELRKHYLELAAEYRLAVSGGSDCHTHGLGRHGISGDELLALLARRGRKIN